MKNDNRALLAYCGLYCGDCVIRNGAIADLSKLLLTKLDKGRFRRVGPGLATLFREFRALENTAQCCECLQALSALRCGKTCREGGGSPRCAIRTCCRKKGFEGCWECEAFEQCPKLAYLEPVNGDAVLRNIRNIRKVGMARFLRGTKYW